MSRKASKILISWQKLKKKSTFPGIFLLLEIAHCVVDTKPDVVWSSRKSFSSEKIGKSVFVLQVSNLSNVKPESQDFSCVCKANHTEKLGHFLSTEKAFFHSLGDDLRVVAKIIKLIYSKIKEDCTITEEATR